MKVVVLGTGTAGLTTALILKSTKPNLDVEVIGSPNIGIVGVGESSTEHFFDLKNSLNLSLPEIIKGCHATFKFGVYFEGWSTKGDYIHALTHVISDDSTIANKQEENLILEGFMSNDIHPLEMVDTSTLEPHIRCSLKNTPKQFHFDTFKLNEFLRDQCSKFDISIIEDTVITKFNDDGSVDRLIGETGVEYTADLFVDASGFHKQIVGKMDEFKWENNTNLFVDTAIAFQCEHPENYRCYTTAKRMKNGWMWRIPTYTRMGNGYAFNSNFCTEEQALDEIEDTLGFRPEKHRKFTFQAGKLNTFWQKNVVAIGLSSHFFEPIEATAIGVGIQQAYLLAKYIGVEGDEVMTTYNSQVTEMLEQVATYIELHYKNVPADTPFWEHVKAKIDILPSKELDRVLKILHNRLLTEQDVCGSNQINLFGQHNFNQVAYGLGILSPDVVSRSYKLKNHDSTFHAFYMKHLHDCEKNTTNPTHKELINAINEN